MKKILIILFLLINSICFAYTPREAGIIKAYGGTVLLSGELWCDGSTYNATASPIYLNLYNAIGTNFGGTGITNFAVPDMRGIYLKGAGTTNRTAGKDATGNFYAATLGTYSQDKMQGHRHVPNEAGGAGDSILHFVSSGGNLAAPSAGTAILGYVNGTGVPGADTTNGTPRTGLTTEPQNLGVYYVITY